MDDFEVFASNIVELIVTYIYDTSYLDDLRLSVRDIDFEVNDELQFKGYKCRIVNTLEEYDNFILVSIRCADGKYTVHVISPYFSTFGLTVLLTTFIIDIPVGSDVTYFTVSYTAHLNTGLGLTVDSSGVYGALEESKSSSLSSVTSSGLVNVSRLFNFNLLLGLYRDMLYKSDYCLGKRN